VSKIGELLVNNSMITKEQLDEALKEQKDKKKRLGEILIDLGYLNSEDLFWMLSEQADIPFVEVRPEMLDNELINRFPENALYDNHTIPLYETEDKIYVVIGDPTNTSAIQELKRFTAKDVIASGGDPQKIEQLLNKFYLAQQADKSIGTEYKGKTKIQINDQQAIIEFIEKSGKTTKKKARVNIIINIEGELEKENNE
jgi:type IV pilus assembly protein PilB